RTNVYLQQKQFEKAIAQATAVLALENEEASAYAFRGAAYAEQRKDAEASADLAKAAQLDNRFAELKRAHEQMVPQVNFKMPQINLGQNFSNPTKPGSWKLEAPWLRDWGVIAAILFVAAIVAGAIYARCSAR